MHRMHFTSGARATWRTSCGPAGNFSFPTWYTATEDWRCGVNAVMSLPKIFGSRWRPLRNVNLISTRGHLVYYPLAVPTAAHFGLHEDERRQPMCPCPQGGAPGEK